MQRNGKQRVKTSELWAGLQDDEPALTAVSETRKTPRATCMRDLRKDARFAIGEGIVTLK